jgi:hypothetical protein
VLLHKSHEAGGMGRPGTEASLGTRESAQTMTITLQ